MALNARILLLNTSAGVFKAVPTKPPILPEMKLFRSSCALLSAFGNRPRTWKIHPKYPPFQRTWRQKVLSRPAYIPSKPSRATILRTTSAGPEYRCAWALSCHAPISLFLCLLDNLPVIGFLQVRTEQPRYFLWLLRYSQSE